MNTVVMAHPPTPSRKEPALQIGRGLQVALGAIAAVAFIALVASVFVFTWPVTVGLAGALALSAIAYTTLFLATKSISARNPPSLSGTEAAPPPDLPPLLASAAEAAPSSDLPPLLATESRTLPPCTAPPNIPELIAFLEADTAPDGNTAASHFATCSVAMSPACRNNLTTLLRDLGRTATFTMDGTTFSKKGSTPIKAAAALLRHLHSKGCPDALIGQLLESGNLGQGLFVSALIYAQSFLQRPESDQAYKITYTHETKALTITAQARLVSCDSSAALDPSPPVVKVTVVIDPSTSLETSTLCDVTPVAS